MLLTSACAGDKAVPVVDDGCGPLTGPIMESNRFTPYEDQRDLPPFDLPPVLVLPGAVEVSALPDELRTVGDVPDGLPVVATFVSPVSDLATVYFHDRALTNRDTHETLLAESGVYLDRQLSGNPGENFGVAMANQARDRAVVIRLGTYDAALIWADPDRNGTRLHNLMWSDATHIYTLTALRSPEGIVTMGRAVVCGG